MTYSTTKEERKIIAMLPNEEIEEWAKSNQFWRIYREVIRATKKYFKIK